MNSISSSPPPFTPFHVETSDLHLRVSSLFPLMYSNFLILLEISKFQVQQAVAQAAQQLQQLQKQSHHQQHQQKLSPQSHQPGNTTPPSNNIRVPAHHIKQTPARLLDPDETTDLEELEQFAKTFKQRRIKLGKRTTCH